MNSDYVVGTQQIIDNYPTVGHAITNFTDNPAGSMLTLRGNENINLAQIDNGLLPNLANE